MHIEGGPIFKLPFAVNTLLGFACLSSPHSDLLVEIGLYLTLNLEEDCVQSLVAEVRKIIDNNIRKFNLLFDGEGYFFGHFLFSNVFFKASSFLSFLTLMGMN